MASVAQQLLIDTKTGQYGSNSMKSTSWNQRQDNFTIFAKLEGSPLKKLKVEFETSPNGTDWKPLKEVEMELSEEVFFHDLKDDHMLAHFRAKYDSKALWRVTGKGKSKKEEKVADLKVAICYRDKR